MIRLIIADDHPLIRAGLKHVIEDHPDIEVVAEVECGANAIAAAESTEADVMLLDITMPGPGIEEILNTLRERAPTLSVLVLSVHPEEQYAIRLLRAGAAGYLSKQYSGAKNPLEAQGRFERRADPLRDSASSDRLKTTSQRAPSVVPFPTGPSVSSVPAPERSTDTTMSFPSVPWSHGLPLPEEEPHEKRAPERRGHR
jgi:DNA-binding NarL/FixJ family response regulator